jgi:outer membrane protein assembly factor BamB
MRATLRSAAGCALLLAGVPGFWATAAAQGPLELAVPVVPERNTTPDADPESPAQREGLAGSLQLRTDRAGTERLEAARTQLQQGQVAEALRQLQQLPVDSFIVTGGRILNGPWATEQVLRQLTPGQRETFEASAGPAAAQAWQRFLDTQEDERLQEFCRDHGETQTGLVAWQTLANRQRDAGRWSLSAAAWQRVQQHPHATPRDRAMSVVGQLEASWRQNDPSGVRDLFETHRELLRATPLTIAGRRVLAAEHVAPWMTDAGGPERMDTASWRPALTPRWTLPLRPPRDLGPHLDQWFGELRDHGVWLLPAAQPLLTDRLLLVRSAQALLALDRATGRVVWQIPFDDWPWIESNPGILDNPGYRTALLEQMGRRLLADTVMNRIVADGQRVYLAQESRPTQGNPANFGAPAGRGVEPGGPPGARHNHLAAYDLTSGELAWRIGGMSAGPSYPLAGEFFCGPPTVVDDVLYVAGQQQTELQLLAIESRRGELLWKTTLGDLPRQLASDPARQRIACPVVWQNGVLLCPTSAGALLAVDPLTRSPRWAFRYGVSLRESTYRQRNENTAFLPDPWWDAWRDVSLQCRDNLAVLASPESDRLHGVDIDRGESRWNVPRGDGLCLLGLTADAAIVLEPTALRAHDLATGRVTWQTAVGEVAGRPVLTGTHAVVSTADGGVVRLRLADGVVENGAGTAESPLGNLAFRDGDWYSVSTDTLAAWPDLTEARPLAEMVYESDPDDPAGRLQSARSALEAGEPALAWERLRSDSSLAAQALKRLAVGAILSRHPERWAEYRETWESLSPVERVERALQLSDAAARTGDVPSATELLVSALETAPTQGAVTVASPRRVIRPDLALNGALTALVRSANVSERQVIESLLAARWDAAAAGSDPFAVQRLSERWAGLEFTLNKLSTSGQAPFLGLPLLAVELRLLEAAGSGDESVRAAAFSELMQQLSRSGFRHEADDYRRGMLRGDYGPAAHAAAVRLPASETSWEPEWPTMPPQVDSQRERNEDVYQFAAPLDAESSPLFDRLDVLVDRQGRSVRFSGGGVSGLWTVALPASHSSYRYLQHHTLGWGRGGVLILRVGFELFALAPFNERGEPQAKVLWTLNTAGEPPPSPDRLRLDTVPAVPGVREDEYRVVDYYNRTIGQVGPVRAGFLCYAERSKLVSIDTLTGQQRWVRYDLPAGFVLGGDDDVLFVWQPQAGRIEWLQASDGRTIATQRWRVSPDDVVLQSGRRFWHWQRGPQPRLVCEDRFAGRRVWTRDLAVGEIPFALNGATLGVVRPGSTLELLSATTGVPWGSSVSLPGPEWIDRVVVSRDDRRWYVAVSERVPQQAGLQQAQLRNGFRAPFITGPLVALDRNQGTLLWTASLEREPWSLDQPRAAPLLMQVYKLPLGDLQAGKQADGIVQLRDKRDGQVMFRRQSSDLVGYATLSADPDRSLVDLVMERETVRLRYRPLPPPPALPDR